MAKRRSNDEGTIFEYPEGSGTWYAQLDPDEQGKRPKRRAKSQKEALAKLREMQRERAQGVNLTSKQPTIAEFITTWLEQVVRRSGKASTLDSYSWVLQHYVVPRIGSIRLNKLTTPQVQQLVNDMDDEGYKPETVRNPYRRLRSMLDVAVQWRLVTHNVAIGVKLPRIDPTGQRVLSLTEVLLLLDAVEGHRLATLYHCYVSGTQKG